MKKLICLILTALAPLLIFAKPNIDLRTAPDATNQILNEISSKKIIFISENHDEVYPLYYLSENLELFYKAGIRYLFLEEESDNYMENPEKLILGIFPPWQQQGSKFQYQLFEDKIIELNKSHKDDPLIVVWPETGIIFDESDWADTHQLMNKRDLQAQKTIIEIMDNTDKKGLIFYGNGHGQKEAINWDSTSKEPYWIPTGYYLNNHYGKDFCTFNIFEFTSNSFRTVSYQNKNDVKIIPDHYLTKLLDGNSKKYDYYCAYSCGMPGVPSTYVPTRYNLNYLIRILSENKISDESKIDPWTKKSEQLLAIYFLKYHFGKDFDFNMMSSEKDLQEALAKIQKEKLPDITYDLDMLEQYMSFLYGVSYSPTTRNFIFCMNKAHEINSKDIWPLYWLALHETNTAKEKNSKNKFKKALDSWNILFQNELLYSSPVLKISCQKAALCAEKANDKESCDYYRNLERKINPLFDIDYEYYKFFSW